jgi:hypothetical protein
MDCVVSQKRLCAVIGVSLLIVMSGASRATAQDRMRGGDEGSRNHGTEGMGPGIGIGIGSGIMREILTNPQNQQNPSGSAPNTRKPAAKRPENDTIKKTEPKKGPEHHDAGGPPANSGKTDTPPTTAVKSPEQTPPTPPPATGTPSTTATGTPSTTTTGTPSTTATGTPSTTATSQTPPEECPQRGKGCAALIIDFLVDTLKPGDLRELVDHLKGSNGCDVDFVEYREPDASMNSDGSMNLNAPDHATNLKNLDKDVDAAIARHRQKVEKGVELAIEIIRGEGYPAEVRSCGSVGPPKGRSLDRQIFHFGNYQAANKHVCGWLVADLSCYSGYTPQVVDELNNRGLLPVEAKQQVQADGSTTAISMEAACKNTPPDNCPTHAGYDFDIAVGQGPSNRKSCALFTPHLRDKVKAALVLNGKSIQFRPPKDFLDDWRGFGSYYSDKGYKYCAPYMRAGYKTGPK